MNIYLENAGVVRNCRYIKKLSQLIGKTERIDLFLRTDKRIGLFAQMLLVICVPSVKTMELTVPVSKLLPQLVWFANRFPRYSMQFVVDKPLTKRKWQQLCKLRDVIRVDDVSGADHTAFYQSDRRVIFRGSGCDMKEIAHTYYAAVKMPVKQCQFSSCLGKTVYISKEGMVSFCVERPRQTCLGKIGELTELFHTPQFMQALKAMIAKRGQCSATCSHYQGCAGGCVFWEDCSAFRKACDEAAHDITNLIEARCDLSELPIYKERSVVYRLFSRKNYTDSVK